ncbi:hypothetical protein BJ508DRAFT_357802 [Ascobolus immersus RN42]|uniref:Uncharacterized protein n=1 Tax=Ascobolus immersus RN42 TaxID=1160509 RepID=A0A3N4IMP4_ASCIM|nr:hypothetical protein BJ508DRAFT_357802 [Ascobolus immersus RN42]
MNIHQLLLIAASTTFLSALASPRIAKPLPTGCFRAMEDAGILDMQPGDAEKQYSLESISRYSPHFNVYYKSGDNYTETNEAYYAYLASTPGAWYTVRNFTATEDGRNGTEVHRIGNRYAIWWEWHYYELVRSPVVEMACMTKEDGTVTEKCITSEQVAEYDLKQQKELADIGREILGDYSR